MIHRASYQVGREKVREYAAAVGEESPLHFDPEAARAQGFEDVVAPPMFAAVYCGPAIGPALLDPEHGIDFARMLHAAQEFTWHRPVVAGDEIETVAELTDTARRGEMTYYTFTTRSTNQRGELVCEGTWLNLTR
ncbi:MAG TPA: MaoC family dehydratase N-terminal domain-containing protein [Solirubrobacteraceae bacterium]